MAYFDFSVSGARLSAFRDALRAEGLACRGQQLRNNVFYARTAARNRKLLERLAAQYDVTLVVTARHGLRYRLYPYRHRFGLLCGLLCGAALIWWCSATVRSIEILGNETISDAEILQALSALGVERGVPFREIPYTYVEQRMRLRVRDIEWITLRHTGGRLIVDLTEERPAPELADRRLPTNYIAAVPAQITAMDIRGGQAVRAVGDTVRPGEVILSGIAVDERGITRYYHADGIVTGIYQAVFQQEQPFVMELPVHGRTATGTVLELFGKRFSLTRPPALPGDAADWEYEETACPLMLLGRALPFSRIDCHYTERATALAVCSEAEARALLEESAARYLRNFHAEDTLISQSAEFSQTDLGISLKINYVFEGVIGKTCEIFVKLS